VTSSSEHAGFIEGSRRRPQILTGSHGGRRYRPWAFTEHGAVKAASVLNSERAVKVSIYVVGAFVKLRELLGAHNVLAQKLTELERKVASYDGRIRSVFQAIRQLMEPPLPKSRRIGFKT
jgi:hypothetical protein